MTIAPSVVFPDAAAVASGYLRPRLADPVGTLVPTVRPPRFILVRRLGGPRRNVVVDAPMLGIECWAESDEAAADLAQVCRAHLHAMTGSVQGGVAVYRTAEAGGPASLPDPLSDQPRYTFTVIIEMRGAPL